MTHSTTARRLARALAACTLAGQAATAGAFCGFYVGKADASLFNEASQVILVRDGQRTVVSMLSDYRGEPTEFALVVPVPEVLERGQVNVGDRRIFERLDAYSAPRLAEYYDPDPCGSRLDLAMRSAPATAAPSAEAGARDRAKALGVTVEASYTVGEYDIVILSAKESDGLQTWLQQNGYRVPAAAASALAPYIRQGMRFFVAKVNLKEHAKAGFTTLRPLQFAFESPRFMLPLRLGMVNAAGPQDLIVYALTRSGRVESSNYRTVKLPANVELPVFVRPEFRRFYRSMFDEQARREDHRVVFTEYFWDMAWCDPCAADPLSPQELKQAGVFWLDAARGAPGEPAPMPLPRIAPGRPPQAQPVMLTRLHLRYTRDTFPEDLVLHETRDRANFQTRYVLRHPFDVAPTACEAARGYQTELARRREREAQTLANLTGWSITDIRSRAGAAAPPAQGSADPPKPWWHGLWPSQRTNGG